MHCILKRTLEQAMSKFLHIQCLPLNNLFSDCMEGAVHACTCTVSFFISTFYLQCALHLNLAYA